MNSDFVLRIAPSIDWNGWRGRISACPSHQAIPIFDFRGMVQFVRMGGQVGDVLIGSGTLSGLDRYPIEPLLLLEWQSIRPADGRTKARHRPPHGAPRGGGAQLGGIKQLDNSCWGLCPSKVRCDRSREWTRSELASPGPRGGRTRYNNQSKGSGKAHTRSPVGASGRHVRIALADPSDLDAIDKVQTAVRRDLESVVAEESQIEEFITRLYPEGKP
jgi:hypothetical protein